MRYTFFLLLVLTAHIALSQIRHFPYRENFDSVTAPDLPRGWITTTNRLVGGDFTTTTSSELSPPNAVLSSNARILQQLTTPLFDFTNTTVESLLFYERRSSSHNSGVLLEASTDGGNSFTVLLGDTLKNPLTTSYVRREFKLPTLLNNQSSVKLRWTIIGDGTGTSGTYRIDNLSVLAIADVDVGVAAIRFEPKFPAIGDSVTVHATVKNFGTQPIAEIPIEFYQDTNSDSFPDPDELLASQTISQTLFPLDTIDVQFQVPYASLGEHTFMIQAAEASDQQEFNNLSVALLSVGLPYNSIVINEIMYAPNTPEPEWIELTNIFSDSVNLKQWKISDRGVSTQYEISSADYWLLSNDYVVIADDSLSFQQTHPDVINVLYVSRLPSLNNTTDDVVLYDNRGATMDSVSYKSAWGGTNGKSLERIEQTAASNDSSNWGTSGDSSGSTAGRYNFLTPLEYDMKAVRIIANDAFPGSAVPLQCVIFNSGRQTATGISVKFYADENRDSLPQLPELLGSAIENLTIAQRDSMIVHAVWEHPPSGEQLLITVVEYAEDLRQADNIAYGKIRVAFPKHTVVINEILYDPPAGFVEYVELYNRGTATINLAHWRLNGFSLGTSPTMLRAGASVVVSADYSILQRFPYLNDTAYHVISLNRTSLGLNNSGDSVILRDITGLVIDSLYYFPTWHNPELDDVSGRSLERINPNLPSADPRNWSTCVEPLGGSPGKQNSIFTTVVPGAVTLSFSPNPFSPDGDGFEDHTIVFYELPSTTALIRLRIYDSKGRLVRTLANNEPSGATGQIIWDGLDDNKERVRIGIYIVLLEALDAIGGELQKTKGVVVVAAKL